MKWKTLAFVLALVVSSIWVIGWTAHSQETAPKRTWEYKVVYSTAPEHRNDPNNFDKLGEQGWELVAVDQNLQNGTSYSSIYYFKRPK